MADLSVSIIGIGRLGGALALALGAKNYSIENLVARSRAKAETIARITNVRILAPDELGKIESDVIFITTQDAEIGSVARNLAANLTHKPFVFHTSGALSSEVLDELKNIGCCTGSLHPLVSVSDAALGSARFADVYFCAEGEREAVRLAEKIVRDLGGKSFTVETKYKTLYHAAAVTACGHLVALIDAAIEIMTKCGVETADARKILLPLVKSTVENLETQTTAEALTGTIARADVATFEKHLAALEKSVSQNALEIYLQLAFRSANLAERQNPRSEKRLENLENIRKRILLAKKNLK